MHATIFHRMNRSRGFSPLRIAVHESKFATIFYTPTSVNPHHPMDTQFTLLTVTFPVAFLYDYTARIAFLEERPSTNALFFLKPSGLAFSSVNLSVLATTNKQRIKKNLIF